MNLKKQYAKCALFLCTMLALPVVGAAAHHKSESCSSSSESSSSSHHKDFTHEITLDAVDINNIPQNVPVTLTLDIEVRGRVVHIHVPSFNFVLPVDGALFTASGFLPESIWPADLVPEAFFVASDFTGPGYALYVTNSGSFLLYALDGEFLPAGDYNTHATTLTYLLTDHCGPCKAPKNIKLTDETSNASFMSYAGEFLEFSINSIVDNHFAVSWSSNIESTSPNGRNHLDFIVRTGTVSDDGKTIELNDPVTVLKAPSEKFFFDEGAVAIDPFNTDHLIVICPGIDRTLPVGDPGRFTLWRAVSLDGGETWDAARLDGTFGLPTIPRDGVTPIFDDFGNLWVPYLFATDPVHTLNPINIVWALSTDGGFTWTNAGEVFVPINNPSFALNLFDYAHAAFGGDGQGGKALWTSFTYYHDDPASPYGYNSIIKVSAIPVTGLGQFGPNTLVDVNPTAFPPFPGTTDNEIAVTPDGKVYLFGTSFDTPTTSNRAYLYVNPTGMVNLSPDSWSGHRAAFYTNTSKTDTIIPYQPRRSILNHGVYPVFDPELNRFYAGIVDMRPDFSGNMTVTLVHTDDDGLTWSKERPIADMTVKARGSLNMSRDPVSGTVLFSWLDTRGQADQNNVNTFMALLSKQDLNKTK